MKLRSIVPALLFLVLMASVASYYTMAGSVTVQAAEEKAFDPVCGMKIDKASALSSEYDGKTYYFCSEMCKAKFGKDSKEFACLCGAECKCAHCQGTTAKCGCESKGAGHKGGGHQHREGHDH